MSSLLEVLELALADAFTAHERQAKQYGLEKPSHLHLKEMGDDDIYVRLLTAGVWGIRGLDPEVIPDYVVLGLKPTRLHLGHVSLLREVLAWQKKGTRVQVVVGSFEELARQGQVHESDRQRLIATVCAALGHTPDDVLDDILSPIWPHIEAKIAQSLGRKLLSILSSGGNSPDYLLLRVASLVVTAILSPQLVYAKSKRVVFPCGTNELPFAEMAKRIALTLGFMPPIITCREFLRTTDGKGRMSTKRKDTSIFLDEDREVTAQKLSVVITGGREPSLHKSIGGDIRRCEFFKIVALLLNEPESARVADQCLTGKLCQVCKKDTIPLLNRELDVYRVVETS